MHGETEKVMVTETAWIQLLNVQLLAMPTLLNYFAIKGSGVAALIVLVNNEVKRKAIQPEYQATETCGMGMWWKTHNRRNLEIKLMLQAWTQSWTISYNKTVILLLAYNVVINSLLFLIRTYIKIKAL